MKNNPLITPYLDKYPSISESAFIDITARIIGDVKIEDFASIWPFAVIRADSGKVTIGKNTAILDKALIEAPENNDVVIEENVIISHSAIIHGATIKSNVLVGIGAIVLDGAIVSSGSIIGAGAIVPPNTIIEPNSLVLGIPSKIIRTVKEEEHTNFIKQLSELLEKSKNYKKMQLNL